MYARALERRGPPRLHQALGSSGGASAGPAMASAHATAAAAQLLCILLQRGYLNGAM